LAPAVEEADGEAKKLGADQGEIGSPLGEAGGETLNQGEACLSYEATASDQDQLPPVEVKADSAVAQPDMPAKTRPLSFMDRYAKSRGFRWHEAERCYAHASGAWIEKGDSPFNWQERLDSSDLVKRLFVTDHSLADGVEIPYELWRLMEINPDSITLVLCAEDGEPTEWSAADLQQLKVDGQVQVFQSRFILRETSFGVGSA
jgi:hypothetical protein